MRCTPVGRVPPAADQTKMSVAPLVSPATRLVASDWKAMRVPSLLIDGWKLLASVEASALGKALLVDDVVQEPAAPLYVSSACERLP